MKKTFVLLFLFALTTTFSQTILEPGVYKSNVKGQNIMLKVFEDNKYEMSVLFGQYTVDNDTITFGGQSKGESNFKIKADTKAEFSSTLKIKFTSPYMMFVGRSLFIGTQKDDNSMVEYKPIYEYIKNKEMDYSRNKALTISVDKTKYLYFVENIQNETTISKFEINPETNVIEVEYEALSLANIKLKGVVDPETKKIAVMEGRGANPIFVFEKEGTQTPLANAIKPLEVKSDKNWVKNNGFEQEENTEYFGERETATYTFKHANLKTYDEALKSIAKSDSKFLVVAFDNDNEAKKKFTQFIKNSEQEISNYMRRAYNSERDHFNFYLATEKDKKLLEKFKIKDNPTLLFLNSNGDLLYHTKGTLEDNSEKLGAYYSVVDELKIANAKMKLDKLLVNKKTPLTEMKKAFLEVSVTKKGASYDDDFVSPAADTVAVAVDRDYNEAVADTALAAVSLDDDYYHVEDRGNLYSFKAKKSAIEQQWKNILDFYTKLNTYDVDFVEIAKRELIGIGFTTKLFDEVSTDYQYDFRILDYLYKNYNQITADEVSKKDVEEYDDMGYRRFETGNYNLEIASVLSTFFSQRLSSSTSIDAATTEKYMKYNKTFLQLSGYNLNNFKTYLEKISNNASDKSFYFSEYEDFFQTLQNKTPSLIETLDAMYSSQKEKYMDWSEFKQIYSGMANTVAWDVVESKTKDANLIQKAVQWSESSLKIEPKSPYYLDTLGQLYYMNNQKDKAIITEQKAIDSIVDGDKEQIKTYTDVLQKMKNGTY